MPWPKSDDGKCGKLPGEKVLPDRIFPATVGRSRDPERGNPNYPPRIDTVLPTLRWTGP
jgi:hypothetical protein